MALGLPRRIDSRVQGTFNPTQPVTINGRHSSPVHIHVARSDAGWLVRAVAFPAAYLPNLNTSTEFLKEFLKDFDKDLRRRAQLGTPRSSPPEGPRVQQQQARVAAVRSTLPQAKDRVEAVLLEEKTRKGGWKAKHEPSGLSGPIQNNADVPEDVNAGDKLTLIVAFANRQEIAFHYPTDKDKPRALKAKGKGNPKDKDR
jgi:CRISPR-associated protein Cmr6